MTKISKAQQNATNKYQKNNMEIISFRVQKKDNKREKYKKLASVRGVSLSALIQALLDQECEKEGI